MHLEQNRLYLPNQNTAIMNKNSKYKWQATRRANCPSKLAAIDIAISLNMQRQKALLYVVETVMCCEHY